jgi:hypothetical protein
MLHKYCDVYEAVYVPEDQYGSGNELAHFIDCYHNTVGANLQDIRVRFPTATVDSITAYGFLRDPVERWCSAVDFHYKRLPSFLVMLKSVFRNPNKMRFLEGVINRAHSDQYINPGYGGNGPRVTNPSGLREVNEFYSPEVKAEMAQMPWEMFPVNLDESEFFYPQSHWLREPNTIILDYSKFNEEMGWMISEWGARLFHDGSNSIYRNTSEVKKLPVSDSMRKTIMDAYHMDYDLTFHTVS